MAGGKYDIWEKPRHLTKVHGETLIERTVRLLRHNEVYDIYITTNNYQVFDYCMNTPTVQPYVNMIWTPSNEYVVPRPGTVSKGDWCDCFCLTEYPNVCYLMGDVVFSSKAIETIVNTPTNDIEFFASAPPFAPNYSKPYAEPFAFKVHDNFHLKRAIQGVRELDKQKKFRRPPIAWELWQVIKGTPINMIDYTNYTVINDFTCDIDEPKDIKKFEGADNG